MSVLMSAPTVSVFQMWSPAMQATVLFLSTFVLEDVAAVGAGLLIASGVLAWPMAFGACFLGIWIGDAGLYSFARIVGRHWFEHTSGKRFSSRVADSERWFARRGSWILVFSRLLPGARLPTYLAAGFLRLPLTRFLLVTGIASLVWTMFVLFAAQLLGAQALLWLRLFGRTGWVLLFSLLFMFVSVQAAKRAFILAADARRRSRQVSFGTFRVLKAQTIMRSTTFLSKGLHWEFWPAWLFYPPVVAYGLWLAIKYRSLTLPTAANPGIFSGGIIGESKIATLEKLMETSPGFTAEAELIAGASADERLVSICEICRRRDIPYPFVLKPDIGQRGAGVKVIHNEAQAIAYLGQTDAPIVLQRYIHGPHEVGIFYFRFPSDPRGHIFAITEKVFPTIVGDGRSTISELIWSHRRARFLAAKYLERLKGREQRVLAHGESLRLVQAGNHAQGCIFRDGMKLCTTDLADRIDAVSQKLPGFYVGRYDIRYANPEDLSAGRNFQIIELNGAASEATSIYDARNSLLSAYRTLFRQWELVFAIGAANRERGARPTPLAVLCSQFREYRRLACTYPITD